MRLGELVVFGGFGLIVGCERCFRWVLFGLVAAGGFLWLTVFAFGFCNFAGVRVGGLVLLFRLVVICWFFVGLFEFGLWCDGCLVGGVGLVYGCVGGCGFWRDAWCYRFGLTVWVRFVFAIIYVSRYFGATVVCWETLGAGVGCSGILVVWAVGGFEF